MPSTPSFSAASAAPKWSPQIRTVSPTSAGSGLPSLGQYLQLLALQRSTSSKVHTIRESMPRMSCRTTELPVATSTASYPLSSWGLGTLPYLISTPSLATCSRIQSAYQRILFLPWTVQQYRIAPPTSLDFSNTVAVWPRRVAMRAASSPAGPPPTMASLYCLAAGSRWMKRSSPTAGLMAQRMWRLIIRDSCQQPTRQEMHLRISSFFPALALLAQ